LIGEFYIDYLKSFFIKEFCRFEI